MKKPILKFKPGIHGQLIELPTGMKKPILKWWVIFRGDNSTQDTEKGSFQKRKPGMIDMKVVIATGNAGKVREFKKILSDYEVVSMKEDGIHPVIVEDGETFEANARIKAQAVVEELRSRGEEGWSVADDSGIEIDAMPGQLGVYSSRFMGEDTSYDVKNQYILDTLKGIPEEKRSARYVCAIVAIHTDGREVESKGVFEGSIAHEGKGENGFGYDPIFYVPELGKTAAQISEEEKNKISHRGKALEGFIRQIR